MRFNLVLFSLALAGCSVGPDGGHDPGDTTAWEQMPRFADNPFQEPVFQVAVDANGKAVAATRGGIWRYSESRGEWGQVGLGGRGVEFLQRSFALASDGTAYAVGGQDADDADVYVLAPGHDRWQPFDDGLPPRAESALGSVTEIQVDRHGLVYAQTSDGVYRRAPSDAAWKVFDPAQVATNSFLVADDNTLYASGEPVSVLAPGATSFAPLPTVAQLYSINHDGSLNVRMTSGTTGRLDKGAAEPTPYPSFYQLAEGADNALTAPWADQRKVSSPVPFGMDSDGKAYAAGKDEHGDGIEVYSLSDEEWTQEGTLGQYYQGRSFLVTPDGDLYSWSASSATGVQRRKH